MAQTTKTDKKSLAEQRRARLAVELRSNLRKRKQQARSRAQQEGAAAEAEGDEPSLSKGPGGSEGEIA